MGFSLTRFPETQFGGGILDDLGSRSRDLGSGRPVLVIADGFLAQSGVTDRIAGLLDKSGLSSATFSDFGGEPKADHIRAASARARDIGAGLVIGIGGGSALDITKVVGCCAVSDADPLHYALAANPLPSAPLPKIMIPTTAGTGSEVNGTSIFSNPDGKKVWVYGPEAKADLVLLDPELTQSLPAALTAWCGLDAFVHAFEAATNRWAHTGAKLYAHQALRLITGALTRAVASPEDMQARGDMILASCYAGYAIENCGTAIAHNISHALAGLAPVHHGLATALAFERTLPWLVEADTPELKEAAQACGLPDAADLPAFVTGMMDATGIKRKLPAGFDAFTGIDLAREMLAEENRPMRDATIRDITEGDIARIADDIMTIRVTA